MKKGDIILIRFPFTDLKGSKNRPAVVLWTNHLDVMVCFITSELKWQEEHDMTVSPDDNNGLKTVSLIRISKIATLDVGLVMGVLGSLSSNQVNILDRNIIRLLQLEKT